MGKFIYKKPNIGDLIGMFTILDERIEIHGKRKRVYYLSRCKCGKEKWIRSDGITKITSCGCKRDKDNAIRMTKHSLSRTRLYKIYYGMIARCYHEELPEYMRYGGRGIEVCKEWRNDKNKFFEWAFANGYNPNDHELSLERDDVDGNYCPQNCRWIKIKDQYNNMRKTIRMGNISLAEFCRRANLNYKSVRNKFYKTKDIVYALGLVDSPTN